MARGDVEVVKRQLAALAATDVRLDAVYRSGQVSIIEPEENGFPEFDVELEFARYDSTSDAFLTSGPSEVPST